MGTVLKCGDGKRLNRLLGEYSGGEFLVLKGYSSDHRARILHLKSDDKKDSLKTALPSYSFIRLQVFEKKYTRS